jgi:very-short-patch-repair endonuclease
MTNPKKKDLVPTTRKLVEFLRELAITKDKLTRDIAKYETVLFLDDLPAQISKSLDREAAPEDVILIAPAIRQEPVPSFPDDLSKFIWIENLEDSSLDDPPFIEDTPPSVLSGASGRKWADQWLRWAEADRRFAAARDWHKRLSKAQRLLEVQDDEFEAVLGIGFMSVNSNNFITRHPLITVGLTLEADPVSGDIEVSISPSAKARATDRRLLEGSDFYDAKRLVEWHKELREWEPTPLADEATEILKGWLSSGVDRSFPFDESWTPNEKIERSLYLSWSPCIIIRTRDRSNLVEYFERMLTSLEGDDAEAPLGLAQLVSAIEADERVQWLEEDGYTSAEILGTDPLFPLPANPEQRQIINTLRRDNGVVVQGPPGTGKTHTIANLVSALLAQGQRVLVTSQKAQALRVLREKMPEDIQNLCVSMTDVARGGSKELNASVTAMSDAFNNFSLDQHESKVSALRERRHLLRTTIAELKEQIRASRESETYQHPDISPGFTGTRAAIAEQVADVEADFSWFPQPLPSDAPKEFGLPVAELHDLLDLIRTENDTRRSRSFQVLPDLKQVASPTTIESLVHRETESEAVASGGRTIWSGQLEKIGRIDRNAIKELLNSATLSSTQVSRQVQSPWLARVLDDTYQLLNTQLWRQLSIDMKAVSEAHEQLATLGLIKVDAPLLSQSGPDGLPLKILELQSFLKYLIDGGSFKKGPLRSSAQKKVSTLLEQCQVDGLPIRSIEALQHLITYFNAESLSRKVVERLKDVDISTDESLRLVPRINELLTIQEALNIIVGLGTTLDKLAIFLLANSVSIRPTNHGEINEALAGIRACELLDDYESIKTEISGIQESIHVLASQPQSAPELRQLERAIELRDVPAYRSSFDALSNSYTEQSLQKRCDELFNRTRTLHLALAENLRLTADDEKWSTHLASIPEAWAWAVANRFLSQSNDSEYETELQDKLRAANTDLGSATAKLAAELAWGKCLTMMTADQERALRSYQSNISSKGKGSGKWAGRYAKAARQAMVQARDAVPAWIMPLNEVIETIPPDQNSFDVVIIDEASQAGIEALFLLWLAPRIIVVGDERQCAPSGVVRGGLQPIYDRLDEYLADVPEYLRLEFTPKSNLFSLLSTRFGSVVRLREHFRCMPEIIGWSSAQFYSDAPLIPLRQFGADRLLPLRTTYVSGAYTDGSSSTLTNQVEAEAIVKQIQLCMMDPAYDGKTMGVIALQSAAQVRLLDDLIDVAIPSDQREKRRLRVGTAPDFQGDERNVIFLSMVVAGSEKITSMTQRDWQRRFNVAATRAEDQMWLFHSTTIDKLKSTDLRRSLLSYVMSPPQVFGGDQHLDLRWDSEKREPFGSKFEQRVFLKIREKGYFITPQFEVNGRFIDLVVSGAKGRLAVECDGDYWHSSRDDQMADLDRQLELERAGWRFVRIRESDFNRNPDKSLEHLWTELDRRGIHPNDLRPQDAPASESWSPLGLTIEEGLDGIEDIDTSSSLLS